MKNIVTNNQIDFKFADPAMNQFATFVVEKFTNLDQKVSMLDSKVNNLDQKVNVLDTKVSNLDQKVNHTGILIEGMNDKIDLLAEGFNAHSEKLDLHTEMLEKLGTDVQYLKDVTPAHTDMIHETKNNVKKLENRVRILETA